jgi:hypothetical protein
MELGFHRMGLCEKNWEKMSSNPSVVVSHSRHCSNRRFESDTVDQQQCFRTWESGEAEEGVEETAN